MLAPLSGEEPASPRHRAGVASMAWRTTRRFSTIGAPRAATTSPTRRPRARPPAAGPRDGRRRLGARRRGRCTRGAGRAARPLARGRLPRARARPATLSWRGWRAPGRRGRHPRRRRRRRAPRAPTERGARARGRACTRYRAHRKNARAAFGARGFVFAAEKTSHPSQACWPSIARATSMNGAGVGALQRSKANDTATARYTLQLTLLSKAFYESKG